MGLAGGLAAMAREEQEATQKTVRKGVPRGTPRDGELKGVLKSPHRPPSVSSDDESVYGGTLDKKEMRLRTAERNKARKEALKHKSRMVSSQTLGAANPVFTDQDPFWNIAWQVVNPRHQYVQWWDLMTLHLLVFTAMITPYEIAFMDGLSGTGVELLFWTNQIINLIFLADMILVFVTPFEDSDGVWVTSKSDLAIRYFKGMFVIDLMSIMPFAIIELFAGSGGSLGSLKVFRVLKLFRLLKMLRIFRGLKIVKKYEADFAINYQALNISILLLVLLVTAHWIACLLALICKYDPKSPALEIFLPSMNEIDEEITVFKQYYYCFVWGLMFMTIGMGEGHDSDAESSVLRVYISILLIVGAVANAAIIGGVVAIVDEMNEASREFYSNLNVLNVFLKREDVYNRIMKWRQDEVAGPEFCRRLRAFYLFKFSNSKQYSDLGKILDNVSVDMRRVVSEAMFGDVLRSCGIFKNASADMIAHLAANIEVLVYARGDFVYTTGEPSEQLYFCVKGTVMLPMRGGIGALDVFRQGGEPFGMEVVYKHGEPRSRSAVCSVGTVLLALDGAAIHDAMQMYSEHSMRWRVMVSRNIIMIASALKKAAHEATRVRFECNADAAIAFMEFSLGKQSVFHQDLSGTKENNLLSHLRRLVRQILKEQGLRSSEVERAMEAFRKHEDHYDACTEREIVAAEKVEDLRHLLDSIEDEDGESMEIYFKALTAERIETIESLKALAVCDLKAIDVPLGHALLIVESLKTPTPSIMDAIKGIKRQSSGEAGGKVSVRRDIRSIAGSRSFGSRRQLDIDAAQRLSLEGPGADEEDRTDTRNKRDREMRDEWKRESPDEWETDERKNERKNRAQRRDSFSDDDEMQVQASACWTPTASNVFGSGNTTPPRDPNSRAKSYGRQL